MHTTPSFTRVLASQGKDAPFFSSASVVHQLSPENQLWRDALEEVRHHDDCHARSKKYVYFREQARKNYYPALGSFTPTHLAGPGTDFMKYQAKAKTLKN